MNNIKNIMFLIVVIYTAYGIYKFWKRTKFAKIKMVCMFLICGIVWTPLILIWSYTHPIKATGYIAEYVAKGGHIFYKAKSIVKKIDESLAMVKPITIYREKTTAMLTMPKEIAYDVGLPVAKPKIGFGQKIWRGTWRIAGSLIWTPVGILKTGINIIGG